MMPLLCNMTKTEQKALHNVARDTAVCGNFKEIYQFGYQVKLMVGCVNFFSLVVVLLLQ